MVVSDVAVVVVRDTFVLSVCWQDADTAVALTPTVGTSDGERKLALADDESDEVGSDQAIEVSSDASVKAFVPAHTVESATKYACHFPEKVTGHIIQLVTGVFFSGHH